MMRKPSIGNNGLTYSPETTDLTKGYAFQLYVW